MPKAFAPPRSTQTTRRTVRVPVRMIDDLRANMAANKYPQRQQSRWIEEAILALVDTEFFPELVAEDFVAPGANKPLRISLNGVTDDRLETAIKRCEEEAQIVDVQSKLIRTAIRNRLLTGLVNDKGAQA